MPRCRRNYPGPSSLPAKVRPQLAPKLRHGRSAALHHSAAQHRNASSTATPALSNRPQVHSTAASASPQHHQRHSIAPRFVDRRAALQHQQPAASRPRAQHARMDIRRHSTHALASARVAVALTCSAGPPSSSPTYRKVAAHCALASRIGACNAPSTEARAFSLGDHHFFASAQALAPGQVGCSRAHQPHRCLCTRTAALNCHRQALASRWGQRHFAGALALVQVSGSRARSPPHCFVEMIRRPVRRPARRLTVVRLFAHKRSQPGAE